jgi:hypothetical protein
MSLLITMLSFFFLDNTNIAAYPSPKDKMPILLDWFPRVGSAAGGQERAGEDPLLLSEPGECLGGTPLINRLLRPVKAQENRFRKVWRLGAHALRLGVA